MSKNKAIIVIPARIESTRFPGKPMALINGISMLERVWRIASSVELASSVLIATDSEKIVHQAKGFGAEVVLTSKDCRTGTDRVAEVGRKLKLENEIVVSFQGDAVLTPSSILNPLIECFDDSGVNLATPACLLEGRALEDFVESKRTGSTTGTMVVFDKNFDALYFSRSIIPFSREQLSGDIYRHIGLYAYRAKTLFSFSELPPGRLEEIEKLEQLRALENGIPIRVVPVSYQGRTAASVDNPEDIAKVEEIIAREGELPAILGDSY